VTIGVEIDSYLVSEGKEARLQYAAAFLHRCRFLNRPENRIIVDEMTGFPKVPHDEFVDLMGYACEKYFDADEIVNVLSNGVSTSNRV
jgi:phage terminase large subunit-like protein